MVFAFGLKWDVKIAGMWASAEKKLYNFYSKQKNFTDSL